MKAAMARERRIRPAKLNVGARGMTGGCERSRAHAEFESRAAQNASTTGRVTTLGPSCGSASVANFALPLESCQGVTADRSRLPSPRHPRDGCKRRRGNILSGFPILSPWVRSIRARRFGAVRIVQRPGDSRNSFQRSSTETVAPGRAAGRTHTPTYWCGCF